MAKTKKRKGGKADGGKASSGEKAASWGGHYSPKNKFRDRIITAAVVAVVVAGIGITLWQTVLVDRSFSALIAEGGDITAQVKTERSDGRRHLGLGESHRYATQLPTSGPHSQQTTNSGFYESPQLMVNNVHALEHGNVIVYYDVPGDEVIETLKDWTSHFSGEWDGVLAIRQPGLGKSIVLNAWTKSLEQPQFDSAVAAAFIDTYRGRGPEHKVR